MWLFSLPRKLDILPSSRGGGLAPWTVWEVITPVLYCLQGGMEVEGSPQRFAQASDSMGGPGPNPNRSGVCHLATVAD